MLREVLNAIPAEQPAVALTRKGAFFARPMLVADIEYRAWTQDGKLRHPSFKGVREMEEPSEVYEIRPANGETRAPKKITKRRSAGMSRKTASG